MSFECVTMSDSVRATTTTKTAKTSSTTKIYSSKELIAIGLKCKNSSSALSIKAFQSSFNFNIIRIRCNHLFIKLFVRLCNTHTLSHIGKFFSVRRCDIHTVKINYAHQTAQYLVKTNTYAPCISNYFHALPSNWYISNSHQNHSNSINSDLNIFQTNTKTNIINIVGNDSALASFDCVENTYTTPVVDSVVSALNCADNVSDISVADNVSDAEDDNQLSVSSTPSTDGAQSFDHSQIICANNKFNSLNSFNAFPNNFNFFHSNVQGLLEGVHFDQLKNLLFKCKNISSIAISETFLRKSNTNKSVHLEGFKIIRADRKGKKGDRNKGGGVAIYVQNNLKTKIILDSTADFGIKNVEFLFIEIFKRTAKIIFGVVYRAPKCTAPDSRKLFDLITSRIIGDHVIIVGDFNINFLGGRSNTTLMNNFTNMFNLVNDECPTHHVKNKNPSQIDLIFTNCINKVSSFGHFPSNISHHDIILSSINFRINNKMGQKTISIRNYKRIDIDELLFAARNVDWELRSFDNVNMMVSKLNEQIMELLNHFAPIKNVKVRGQPKNWFNTNIKRALDERKISYDMYIKNNVNDAVVDMERKEMYKSKCKIVKQLINKSKKAQFIDQLNNANTFKSRWNLIKAQGCCNDSSANECDILNNFSLNEFNAHFASIHRSDGADVNNLFADNFVPMPCNFVLTEITRETFLAAFNKIKSNAVGDDGIPLKFLKMIMEVIAEQIISVFNYCIDEKVYPSIWNKIIVRPLNKIDKPQNVADFRPISVVPVIAKIFAILINDQIVNYLETNSIIHDHQSGFRKNYSCTTALLRISEEIRRSLSKGKLIVYISLDIKSAFPSVSHEALFKVCENYGFSQSIIDLLRAMYSSISQKVKIGNESSDFITINNGILQGSNCSQTLFSIFINDILNVPQDLSSYLFADDFQGFLEIDCGDINAGIRRINADLERINNWIERHGLKLNISKSRVMFIGSERRTKQINYNVIDNIVIGTNTIQRCTSIKNLGVIFDENMTFEAHNSSKIQKTYGALNRLRHTKLYVPNYVKRDIVAALVDPILSYGDIVTYGWRVHGSINDENRILIADNDKIRYIYSLKRSEHITEYRNRLNTLTPENNAKLHTAILIFKYLKNHSPAYLEDIFVLNTNNTRANGRLQACRPTSTFDERRFQFSAINFWNSIPNEILNLDSVPKFKFALKNWLRDIQHA